MKATKRVIHYEHRINGNKEVRIATKQDAEINALMTRLDFLIKERFRFNRTMPAMQDAVENLIEYVTRSVCPDGKTVLRLARHVQEAFATMERAGNRWTIDPPQIGCTNGGDSSTPAASSLEVFGASNAPSSFTNRKPVAAERTE